MLEGVLKAFWEIGCGQRMAVSILGMLEGVLKEGITFCPRGPGSVSMLGMLEGVKRDSMQRRSFGHFSFNPCYVGGVLKGGMFGFLGRNRVFQSLVCWRVLKLSRPLQPCHGKVSILGMLEC